MIPGVYEFRWDAGHVVFVGAFMMIALVLASGLAAVAARALRDLRERKAAAIAWHGAFHELPAARRACRHALSGAAPGRTCSREFACGSCADHPRLAQIGTRAAGAGPFPVLSDRLYDRGHTWVRQAADGTWEVGLDELARRLVGRPDKVEMPAPGTALDLRGPAWRVTAGGAEMRILSPLSGEVVATGGPDAPFWLKVAPARGADDRHLLRPAEASGWLRAEADRLQALLSPAGLGATLADGGTPVEDLAGAIPPDLRERVLSDVLLDP